MLPQVARARDVFMKRLKGIAAAGNALNVLLAGAARVNIVSPRAKESESREVNRSAEGSDSKGRGHLHPDRRMSSSKPRRTGLS